MGCLRLSLRGLADRTPRGLRKTIRRFCPDFLLRYVYGNENVQKLQRAMWAGFRNVASDKLEVLKPRLWSVDLATSAWNLACAHRLGGDYQRALDNLTIARLAEPGFLIDTRHIVIEVDLLLRLGLPESARLRLEEAIKRLGPIPELCFCAVNAVASSSELKHDIDRQRLSWLNEPFRLAGLAPITLKNPSTPLTIRNISAPSAQPDHGSGKAKVSVLMPAFNAEATIAMAIESVLSQTWTNLELMVVDDGSHDSTWSIVEDFAKRDARVVGIRHVENRGAYAARNTALNCATGDFVTAHDSDDWSHPEKIAKQVLPLLDGGEVATATNKIRVDQDMTVHSRPHGSIINECYASLMMRRNEILELGGWDECKMAADDEFWQRLLRRHRAKKTIVSAEAPLSFYLARPESLTNQPATGLATNSFGARRQYSEAFRYWHDVEAAKNQPDWCMRAGSRRFPVPSICKPGVDGSIDYDVMFVSDFSRADDNDRFDVSLLRRAHALQLRCACFHWPRLEQAGVDVTLQIRDLLHEGIADNIVSGERLTSKLTIINDAVILDCVPDTLPEMRTRSCLVIAGISDIRIESRMIMAHAIFGVVPKVASGSDIEAALGNLVAGKTGAMVCS